MTIARRPGEDWPEPPKNEDPLKRFARERRQRGWDLYGSKIWGKAITPAPDPNRELVDAVNNLSATLRGEE